MNLRITFLGQGSFAEPIRSAIEAVFGRLAPLSDADLLVVASWGKILSPLAIGAPKYGALNVHPSLLPRYRGPSPIQTAILNGERSTGVTIIKMDEKLDHGPIVAQKRVTIDEEDDTVTLTHKLSRVGGQLITATIPLYLAGKVKLRSQNDFRATYTQKLKKSAGCLNLNDNPELNVRKVRALKPWPGAYVQINHRRLIIHQADVKQNQFLPIIVQLEGRRKMSLDEFRRGWRRALPF